MKPKTAALWAGQDRHKGDRSLLFRAIADHVNANSVFYPGCYVDVAPSFVFDSVTYLDSDNRAAAFFADSEGVLEIIAQHQGPPAPDVRFLYADYREPLDIPEASFDLLTSLYAGFISEHCTRHLRIGGILLVNSSHGDAAMASLDPRYELSGVVILRSGSYRIDTTNLDTYLIPKTPQSVSVESLHQTNRGIGYTKSPFAYLFTRVA